MPETKEKRVIHEGPLRRDGSAASAGLRLGNPARPPFRGTGDGRRPPRERGRPARILSLCLPLGFPAMLQPTTLPAGTAWARPKQSLGALAGRPGSRRWPRLCQDLCGRDARAPGWALFHDIVEPKEVYPSSCLFVFIRGSSSFNNPVHPVHPCSMSRKPVLPDRVLVPDRP